MGEAMEWPWSERQGQSDHEENEDYNADVDVTGGREER